MATAERRSTDAVYDRLALAARRFGRLDEALGIRRLPPRSVLNLRGDPADTRFLGTVADTFGVGLPLAPNSWTGGPERAALWLGPDEWLLVADDGSADEIEASLRAVRVNDAWLSVVDLSGTYGVLLVSGARALEVLSKGCPLDLHPRVFAGPVCAQTVLGQARVILRLVDEITQSVEIWVRNSFLLYLEAWLADAAAEYVVLSAAERREAEP